MYRRAIQAAPAAATAAASASTNAAASSSSSSLPTSRITLEQMRKSLAMHVANALPASERRAIMEHWASQGDEGTRTLQEAEGRLAAMKAEVAQSQASEAKAVAKVERLQQWLSSQSKIKPEEATHPQLGQLVADIGYKKVYLASIGQLGDVPIWEQQRILRKDRAASIASQKTKMGFPVKLPGVITLYQLPDGEYKLLDGQHRLAALKLLADTGIVSKDTNYVLVEVFKLEKESEAKSLFLEINSAQPVKLIDMPEGVGAHPHIKGIIDGAISNLKETYPSFFKISLNPKMPHVNVDNLRDSLYQHHIVERHDLKSQQDLVAWLRYANETLGRKQDKEWKRVFKGRNQDAVDKAIAKARKGGFYLGLDHTWLSWDH